jgi:hypothetical protein
MAIEILRHGKHANDAQQRNNKQAPAPVHQDNGTTVKVVPASTLPPDDAEPIQAPSTKVASTKASSTAANSTTAKQKDFRQEAEKIVAEEKAQGHRMPTYEVGGSSCGDRD